MLEIRPNCELCNRRLPAGSSLARICSYECTFCVDCVEGLLKNVCPNCGGGFVERPIRPSIEHRKGLSLSHQAASKKAFNTRYRQHEIREFVKGVNDIPAEKR